MADRFSPPFKLEGHVVRLKRSIDKLVMHLETNGSGTKELEMPIKINNDFELIPYQSALLNQKVRYHTDTETHEKECGHVPYKSQETSFSLDVLTGPLTGLKYQVVERK